MFSKSAIKFLIFIIAIIIGVTLGNKNYPILGMIVIIASIIVINYSSYRTDKKISEKTNSLHLGFGPNAKPLSDEYIAESIKRSSQPQPKQLKFVVNENDIKFIEEWLDDITTEQNDRKVSYKFESDDIDTYLTVCHIRTGRTLEMGIDDAS